MRVLIASALRSYTGSAEVDASGATLAALLADLERSYPGIRFRMIDEQGQIRRHIRFFVDDNEARDLALSLDGRQELIIVQALSGG